jgi:hypothetical protein
LFTITKVNGGSGSARATQRAPNPMLETGPDTSDVALRPPGHAESQGKV